MSEAEKPVVRNAIEARAGFKDRPVGAVLGISLGLGGALLALVWYWFFGIT
jgi:hypothetical protein